MKAAFIGAGVMGEAIIVALLGKGIARPSDLVACDISPQRREHIRTTYGIAVAESASDAIADAQIILLAVKPQEFSAVARTMHGALRSGQTVASIMAGIRLEQLRSGLGHDAVVRIMPNTPAQIGEGVSVWTDTPAVTDEGRGMVRQILSALGTEIYVSEEKYIDMATAVSASGPGFVFLLMEAFVDAAVHIGLRRDTAQAMVVQTFLGSARFADGSGKHLADLRNMVTSPGGTTAEGILALEKAGVRAAITEAIIAAYAKTKDLGG